MTGLASTYLTVVHTDDELQEIRYALNTRDDFELPEGMFVPWEDTLCKRALDEDRPCTTDVPAVRGDHDAARSLGLQVYISVPVERPDGKLWGTLCAADSSTVDDGAPPWPGRPLGGDEFLVALSDDHSGGDLVAMADEAMYGVKRSPLRPTAVEPSLTWCR